MAAGSNVCPIEYVEGHGEIESGCVVVEMTPYDDVSANITVYFRTPTQRDAHQMGEPIGGGLMEFGSEAELEANMEALPEYAEQFACDLDIPSELMEQYNLDVLLRDVVEWVAATPGIEDSPFNYVAPRYDEENGTSVNEEPLFSKLIAYGKENGFDLKWSEW